MGCAINRDCRANVFWSKRLRGGKHRRSVCVLENCTAGRANRGTGGETAWISDGLVIACDIGMPFTIVSSSSGGKGETEWWGCITSPEEAEVAVDAFI